MRKGPIMRLLPLFLDISSGELIIIVLAILLIFGPRKIPEMARMFGKGMNEIKRVTGEIRNEIRQEGRRIQDEMDPFREPDKKEEKEE